MAGDPTHKTWFLSKYVVIRTPMAMAVAYLLSFHACIFRKSDNKERMKKHLRVIFIQGPCRRHRILQACLMTHAFVACLHKWLNNDATRANNTNPSEKMGLFSIHSLLFVLNGNEKKGDRPAGHITPSRSKASRPRSSRS